MTAGDGEPRARLALRLRTVVAALSRSEAGVSAVEFALFAPVLFFALLAMVDIGLAVSERMTIDHVLRAGAQSAIVDQSKESVLAVMQSTARKNFSLAGEADPRAGAEPLSLSVSRYCACPDQPETAVACSTTCPGPASTYIFLRMSGQKTYDAMILPSFPLERSMEVQLR